MTHRRTVLRAGAASLAAPLVRAGASALAGVGALAVQPGASAQAAPFPNRTIRLVVPYPAGGGTDIMGRMIAAKLNDAWGQPVIVENRVGASGIIGNDAVAKAAPDGYTVLIGITTLIQMPHLQAKLPYDPFRDLIPVTQIALSADLFLVPVGNPANSLKEFVEFARAQPKKLSYGSYGTGTSSHVHGEMFNAQARLDMAHVPFKGGAPLMTDLLGGQLSAGFVDLSSARAHLKSGKVKALAITGERRFRILPDVPTFTELGYKDFEPYGWFAVLLPAGTPREIVNKLAAEVGRALRMPDVAARLDDLGVQAVGNTPEEFAAAMRRDFPIWGRVIKEANIKLD